MYFIREFSQGIHFFFPEISVKAAHQVQANNPQYFTTRLLSH